MNNSIFNEIDEEIIKGNIYDIHMLHMPHIIYEMEMKEQIQKLNEEYCKNDCRFLKELHKKYLNNKEEE